MWNLCGFFCTCFCRFIIVYRSRMLFFTLDPIVPWLQMLLHHGIALETYVTFQWLIVLPRDALIALTLDHRDIPQNLVINFEWCHVVKKHSGMGKYKFYNVVITVPVALTCFSVGASTGTVMTQFPPRIYISWQRHQMETFTALPVLCEGNSPVNGEFPSQRPVTRNFDVFFDLLPNNRLSKQSWGWWFETQSRSLWCQRNDHSSDDTWDWWRLKSTPYRYVIMCMIGTRRAKCIIINEIHRVGHLYSKTRKTLFSICTVICYQMTTQISKSNKFFKQVTDIVTRFARYKTESTYTCTFKLHIQLTQ